MVPITPSSRAEQAHGGDRDGAAGERGLDTVFAVHGMGGGQQRARRLLAQHILGARRVQVEGGVGLAALELADGERALEAG